jgi:hypothetical protein
MKRVPTLLLCIWLGFTVTDAQTKRDPRAVALAGAYTTIADGIYAVGYNPALLAYQRDKPFMLQLFGIDFGFVGNYFSLSNLSAISGDTLVGREKDLLFRNFEDSGGLTFFQDLHVPWPVVNYASGNMAFTSNFLFLSNTRIPSGLMRLLLYGNADYPDIDLTLNYEVLGVNEFGFSFAVPYDRFAWGLTLKYLQGLFYLGIDPDSSKANLVTTEDALYGSGKYLLRQGIGGSGIGLDLGFATREYNGWRVGISLINAIGKITWNKPSLVKDFLAGSDRIYGNDDDLWHYSWGGTVLNDSMAILYTYTIDSTNAQNLSNDSLFTSHQEIIRNLDEKGNLKEFSINYPAIFRIGISRRLPDYLISTDLVTGFEDRFFARAHWKWSIGVEMTRFASFPLRIGYGWGGADLKELALGFGFHKGPIIFDFGFAFRNGIWIHTMKGLNLSASLAITSFRSRKEAPPEIPAGGPAPVPEGEVSAPEEEITPTGGTAP